MESQDWNVTVFVKVDIGNKYRHIIILGNRLFS